MQVPQPLEELPHPRRLRPRASRGEVLRTVGHDAGLPADADVPHAELPQPRSLGEDVPGGAHEGPPLGGLDAERAPSRGVAVASAVGLHLHHEGVGEVLVLRRGLRPEEHPPVPLPDGPLPPAELPALQEIVERGGEVPARADVKPRASRREGRRSADDFRTAESDREGGHFPLRHGHRAQVSSRNGVAGDHHRHVRPGYRASPADHVDGDVSRISTSIRGRAVRGARRRRQVGGHAEGRRVVYVPVHDQHLRPLSAVHTPPSRLISYL